MKRATSVRVGVVVVECCCCRQRCDDNVVRRTRAQRETVHGVGSCVLKDKVENVSIRNRPPTIAKHIYTSK